MASGECNCGAVQFEIDADLAGVFVCHCSICRRFTGSNGIAVVLVANEQFRWRRGQEFIATWKKPATQWQGWFCKVCGSPVPGENDPTRMFVPAGTLTEGGDALRVIHHVWVGSKAAWDEIGDTGQQHVEAFRAQETPRP
jgi:hypothetical protein